MLPFSSFKNTVFICNISYIQVNGKVSLLDYKLSRYSKQFSDSISKHIPHTLHSSIIPNHQALISNYNQLLEMVPIHLEGLRSVRI
jgi:hypothetical protein